MTRPRVVPKVLSMQLVVHKSIMLAKTLVVTAVLWFADVVTWAAEWAGWLANLLG